MKEKTGEVFLIADDNAPVPGCTISRQIQDGECGVTYFSLAGGTEISAEIHPYGKLIIVAAGSMKVYMPGGDSTDASTEDAGQERKNRESGVSEKNEAGRLSERSVKISEGEAVVLPPDTLAGMKTEDGAVYTEIMLRRNYIMNEAVKAGEVFRLADLVPYQDGRIVNMDVVHNDKMKFALMAFDEGTGLPEHAAPGEALVFALDGEGVVRYDGVDHQIKAGENFHFAKGGLHAIKATKRFKMALLLTLE